MPNTTFGTIWAMRPGAFAEMWSLAGSRLEPDEHRGIRWAAGGRSTEAKAVAVVGLYGFIDKRQTMLMEWVGGTSTDAFGATFDRLIADPKIKGVVLDVDSPGGVVTGVPELAKRIYDARGEKPIAAVSNAEMDSAAYWIASAAHKVFVTPSSSTGSVGVWSAAAEYSKALEADGVNVQVWRANGSPNKAPFLPWSEFRAEDVEFEQSEVDRIYDDFIAAVAKHRGVTVAVAQKQFGQGRSFGAKDAVSNGLADRIVPSVDDVARRMMSGRLDVSLDNERLEAIFAEPCEDDDEDDVAEIERFTDARWRRQGLRERVSA